MTTKITDKNISQLANAGVSWQSVFTGDGSTGLTAVAGRGYFIDTTSGTVTVTLPASPSAGDVVVLKDYARTWGTNAISMASTTFDGVSVSETFSTNGQTITLVYMDGTKGWSLINEDTTTGLGAAYISATGGTVTTSGDFKIHTFTGDGCFVVSCGGNPAGSDTVDYLVVAGGGGGGGDNGGGAGGGGARMSSGTASGCYSASPLGACVSALPVSATTYPITVGAGGSNVSPGNATPAGGNGSNSIFSTITSTGGGGGGGAPGSPEGASAGQGRNGGSGGGNRESFPAGGTGNTPPVSPPQGTPGGNLCVSGSAGGGGATAAGSDSSPSPAAGGAGVTTSISGTPTAYAGGGAGAGGSGGTGGGGPSEPGGGTAGTTNTGGGGGGGNANDIGSGAGGKGIVILRYKFQ
jgi:hypothetical protein